MFFSFSRLWDLRKAVTAVERRALTEKEREGLTALEMTQHEKNPRSINQESLLPIPGSHARTNLVLVLDLDGTLIADTDSHSNPVTVRPYVKEFLIFASYYFQSIGLWTAASKEWYHHAFKTGLQKILDDIEFSFDFVMFGDRCVVARSISYGPSSSYHLDASDLVKYKPLKKVWQQRTLHATKDTVLILDDTPSTAFRNYGNVLVAPTFLESECKDDDYLVRLQQDLETRFLPKYEAPLRSLHTDLRVLPWSCWRLINCYAVICSVRPIEKRGMGQL